MTDVRNKKHFELTPYVKFKIKKKVLIKVNQ